MLPTADNYGKIEVMYTSPVQMMMVEQAEDESDGESEPKLMFEIFIKSTDSHHGLVPIRSLIPAYNKKCQNFDRLVLELDKTDLNNFLAE